jgi:hypothetical protein
MSFPKLWSWAADRGTAWELARSPVWPVRHFPNSALQAVTLEKGREDISRPNGAPSAGVCKRLDLFSMVPKLVVYASARSEPVMRNASGMTALGVRAVYFTSFPDRPVRAEAVWKLAAMVDFHRSGGVTHGGFHRRC